MTCVTSWTITGTTPKNMNSYLSDKRATVMLLGPLEKGWWDWDPELVKEDVRRARNAMLSACDWTQQIDVPLTEAKIQEWVTYRQQLRDITDNLPDDLLSVNDVVWPVSP